MGKIAKGRRRLIEFDPETYQALDILARDRLATIQELADEAFRDLLRKHGRPVGLKDALKASVAEAAAAGEAGREQPAGSRQMRQPKDEAGGAHPGAPRMSRAARRRSPPRKSGR